MTSRSSQDFPLEPALAFLQRVWRLNHALEQVSSRMETQLGVTAQQRLVIRCLGKYPGIGAGQLAEVFQVDPGTVSATLRRLEGRGLVERRRDPNDRRRAVLGLTSAGRALDHPTEGTVEAVVERLLEGASGAEMNAAADVLDRFAAELHATLKTRAPSPREKRAPEPARE